MKCELTETQMSKLKEWQDAIKIVYGEYGSFTFSFRPTGIGEGVTVESDLAKGAILDLTEVENW